MLQVQMEFDEKNIFFSFLLYLSLMIDKLKKNPNVLIMDHMDMEERGFAIGPLNAGQILRHVRITLNKQIHFRKSF